MGRIMAIDYGDARVGIALTDPLQIVASGFKTLENNQDIHENILSICREKGVESIVIGIPFDQNSMIGASARKVLDFSELLYACMQKSDIVLPMYEQDERYTTHDAIDAMRKVKVKKKKKKMLVDQIAAAKILSDFMQSENKKKLNFSK